MSFPFITTTSTGNVGIGTTSPSALVEIASNDLAILKLSGDILNNATYDTGRLQAQIQMRQDGNLSGFNLNCYNGAGTNTFAIENITNTTVGNICLYIGGNGDVGIGTTSPAYTLDVNGTFRSNNINYLTSTTGIANTTNNYSVTSGALNVSGDTVILGSSELVFTSTGVSAPALNGRSVGTKIVLFPGTNVTQGDYAIGIENNHIWHQVPTLNNYGYKFYQGTTATLVIAAGGNVGIGTATPATKLDIQGTLNADTYTGGNISISGSISSGTIIISGSTRLTTRITTGTVYVNSSGNIMGDTSYTGSQLGGVLNLFHTTLHPLTGSVTYNDVNALRIGGGTIGSSWALSQNTSYGLSLFSISSGGSTYSHALTFETNGNITLPRANQMIMFTGSTPTIAGNGATGPLSIDPNFGATSYVRVYDQLTVEGSFNVTATKSFSIPHPNKAKRDDGYYLYHSCVESPNEGDTIQRYELSINSLSYTLDLPDYYYNLCNNIMVFIQSVDCFGMSKYTINIDDVNEKVSINIQVTQNGKYNVLILGTRKDLEAIHSGFQIEKQHPERLNDVIQRCHSKGLNCKYCDNCCNDNYCNDNC